MMSGTSRHLFAACLALAVPACVDGYVEEDDLGTESLEVRTWDPQSEQILGAANPDWDVAYAWDATASLVQPDALGFTSAAGVPNVGSGWKTLDGYDPVYGTALEFRVARALSATDPSGRARYQVQVRKAGELSYVNFCRSTTPATSDYAFAYAVQGVYDKTGRFIQRLTGGRGISFACPVGAAYKAVRWNFAPGAIHPHFPDATVPDGRWMVAATAMARADFCGSGVSHTIDNTVIQFDDSAGYASAYDSSTTLPGDPGEYQLEAAWRAETVLVDPQNKIYSSRTTALCISKWRYQALKPNECSLAVRDPRTDEFAYYCDDYGLQGGLADPNLRSELIRSGAIMFSYSRVNDTGAWEWKVAGADRWVTTERGDYGRGGANVPPTELAGTTYEPTPRYVGALLKSARTGTVPLVQYRSFFSPTVYRVTTNTALNPPCTGMFCIPYWVEPRTIGWVYATTTVARPSTAVKLTEYVKSGQYRLFRAGETIPSGWARTRPGDAFEGYAIR